MRYNPCTSTGPGFRSIYAVAPKPPIPSLRGDAVVTDTRREPCDGWRDFVSESKAIVGPGSDSAPPMQAARAW